LAPGLAELLVVEHEHGEIPGCLIANYGQRAQPHHHLAVAGDGDHAPARLGQGEAERGWNSKAHATPGVEIFGAITGGEAIPGGAAEPGGDQSIAAMPQQLGDKRATCNPVGCGRHCCPNPLAPIMRWLTKTAALVRLLKARSAAAANVSPTSSDRSTGKHRTPMASSVGLTAWPMGTSQGLNLDPAV